MAVAYVWVTFLFPMANRFTLRCVCFSLPQTIPEEQSRFWMRIYSRRSLQRNSQASGYVIVGVCRPSLSFRYLTKPAKDIRMAYGSRSCVDEELNWLQIVWVEEYPSIRTGTMPGLSTFMSLMLMQYLEHSIYPRKHLGNEYKWQQGVPEACGQSHIGIRSQE